MILVEWQHRVAQSLGVDPALPVPQNFALPRIITDDRQPLGPSARDAPMLSEQLLGGSGTFTGNSFQLFGGTDGTGCANSASDCTTLLP
jgi:hypothetical protein